MIVLSKYTDHGRLIVERIMSSCVFSGTRIKRYFYAEATMFVKQINTEFGSEAVKIIKSKKKTGRRGNDVHYIVVASHYKL